MRFLLFWIWPAALASVVILVLVAVGVHQAMTRDWFEIEFKFPFSIRLSGRGRR